MRQLDVGHLKLRALPAQDGKVLAPVELECLAWAEKQRNEGPTPRGLSLALAICPPLSRNVVVVVEHTSKDGTSKLLPKCTLPLTGKGVVDWIITNLAVFDVVPGGLRLLELADDTTDAQARAATLARIVD